MAKLDGAKLNGVAGTDNTPPPTCSPAVQDYLGAIYRLATPGDGRVTTSQLAERLGVRPASVTAMLQKMAAATPALVTYHKSHGARLTAGGRTAALRVVRSHRLLELYLHEKLGYGWDEVHAEANRLAHVVSPAMTERLAEALGHPTHDPHGHAIPAGDLACDPPAGRPLRELAIGEAATVQYVQDDDPAMLRVLAEAGLRPGVACTLLRDDTPNGLLWIATNGGEPVALDQVVAGQVFVAGLDEAG